ncbi:MAG TPA: hypothetical protein PK052_05295 [Anaerohalosphaeraceae bacterium]|nr:hypothetical protein [Phycisphaerae bacterium]HOK94761.1 hypothetical protein [Anaerohalosphaeraceae bacterium]HOL31379.1 hypothetical protein [Anaerohalosphaeraceae bacterium]HOM76323.1 hypothetical protein [Anaerohalosphaeraceae bacterium]HPC64040.1 hypothetical protein [Anaerohalosphaeraceae bacterium]
MMRVLLLTAVLLLAASGCGRKEQPPAEPTVKTAEEFKAEAQKEITAENLSAELDKMEKEVEADMAVEP